MVDLHTPFGIGDMMPGLETQFEETFGGTVSVARVPQGQAGSFLYPENP
jgi:hypothetical protein